MTRFATLLFVLATLLPTCHGNDDDVATLPIATFKLQLTIQNRNRQRRNNLRRQLQLEPEPSSSVSSSSLSVDDAIRPVAEAHLSQIYSREFSTIPSPTQVLLQVATADADRDEGEGNNSSNGNNGSGGSNIYVRSSFVGGVVSFPVPASKAPGRAELERATLDAFRIPGERGEAFLTALGRIGHPKLEGLLLVGVEEVNSGYYKDDGYTSDAGPNNPNAVPSEGAGDPTSNINIWAVAAVAALAAMFLVILLCTGVLYCDWKKRRDRRERRKEEHAARDHNNYNNNNNNAGGGGHRGHRRKGSNATSSAHGGAARSDRSGNGSSVDFSNGRRPQTGGRALEIQVVQSAPSGDTEGFDLSPSTTRGSEEKENADNFANDSPAGNNNNNNNNGNGNVASSGRSTSMFQKMKSSRRSLPTSLPKKAKSRAADLRLQDAAMESSASNNTNDVDGPPPSSADLVSETYAPEIAPSVTDHSVGEDTTMLYPAIHRNRLGSRDRNGSAQDDASDFDGYSMDGMSAIVGGEGFSAYGGSNAGSSSLNDFNASGSGRPRNGRDYPNAGGSEPPRDFDSVWGDDDQSDIVADGGSVDAESRRPPVRAVKGADVEAYGDLTRNLDELVEIAREDGSRSAAGSGDGTASNTLNEFDSESDCGSANRGAFTLELLGKGPSKTLRQKSGGSSSGPSQDDDDSILGGMYRDETTSELGLAGEDRDGPGSVNLQRVPSADDSVDSTPSWAAPIQSALRNSSNIFRTASADKENDASGPNASSAPSEGSQEQRTKDKFVSSLSGSSHGGSSDDGSVASNPVDVSTNGAAKGSEGKQSTTRKATATKPADEKALGLTNSMEDEVDEDPAAMIDNINSMLSECREILDTEQQIA